jgi:1,4-dihydroxy-2-naphthoyl-CoA hydrolase
MSIWKTKLSLEDANALGNNTMIEHLGIRVIEIGDDYLKASMPVDRRTHQPFGILHGGASVALAETAGSLAAQMCIDPGHYCVGLDINANHLRKVTQGLVFALARPIHLGRLTQVWDIRITEEQGKPVCISRLTMSVLTQ